MLCFAYALRSGRYYGLGCSREWTLLYGLGKKPLGIGCWAWTLLSGLGMPAPLFVCSEEWTFFWFWHGCFGDGMLSGTLLWFGHGCSGNRMLSSMVVMLWAWMLRFSYALGNGRVLGTSAWQPLKVYPPKAWEKTNERSVWETAVVASSVLFSVLKTVSTLKQIDFLQVKRESTIEASNHEIRKNLEKSCDTYEAL